MSNELILTTKTDLENLIRDCIKEELTTFKKEVDNPPAILSEILPIEQAAELLNLAKPTVYALTSKRELPFFKNGKKLYFKRSELLQWIEQGKRKSVAEEQREVEQYLAKKEKRK